MKIRATETFVILEDERDDIKDFAGYLEYIVPARFNEQNVIINLLPYNKLSLEQLLLFLKVSTVHRAKKRSFVIVNKAIDPDVIPAEILVVPTLQEAEDVIQLEEIERDLGF